MDAPSRRRRWCGWLSSALASRILSMEGLFWASAACYSNAAWTTLRLVEWLHLLSGACGPAGPALPRRVAATRGRPAGGAARCPAPDLLSEGFFWAFAACCLTLASASCLASVPVVTGRGLVAAFRQSG